MQTLSLVWGILAIIGMMIGFLPCLGAFNWINIPFAGVGAIFSALAMGSTRNPNKGSAMAGLICCLAAIAIGLFRLAIGGGIL